MAAVKKQFIIMCIRNCQRVDGYASRYADRVQVRKKGRKWNFVVILKQQQHKKKNVKKLECDGHSKGSTSEKIELQKIEPN